MPDAPPPIVPLAYAPPEAFSMRPLVRLIAGVAIVYVVPMVILNSWSIVEHAEYQEFYSEFRFILIAECILLIGAILAMLPKPRGRRILLTGAWLTIACLLLVFSQSSWLDFNAFLIRLATQLFQVILEIAMPIVIVFHFHRRPFRDAFAGQAPVFEPFTVLPRCLRTISLIAALFGGIQVFATVVAAFVYWPRIIGVYFSLAVVDILVTSLMTLGAILCFRRSPSGRIVLLCGSSLYAVIQLAERVPGLVHFRHFYSPFIFATVELISISHLAFPLLLILFCLLRPFRPAFILA